MIAITSKRPDDYIARHVLELKSTTDVSRFQKAWTDVLEANPILRARILDLPGQGMVQAILDLPVSWNFHKNLTEYRDADRQVIMGLGKPLLNLSIIGPDSERNIYCSVTIHHSIYDGWSMASLLDQVAMAYEGTLRAPSTSFQWFVKHIRETSVDSTAKFWTEQFRGIQANQYPQLPSPDYEPKADGIFEHSITNVKLTQQSHTISTLIRASWAIVICRQVAGSEALFGTVTAGRQASLPGIESVSGPTVATVPLLIPIDWENSVQHLLESIERQATDMIAFEQTGLREIQSLGGDDAKDACSFQTLLVVQPPIQRSAKQNTIFSPMKHETTENSMFSAFATYALTAECIMTDAGMDLRIRFDSHVIGKVQVERLSHQFERIIRQLTLESNHLQPVKLIESASERELQSIWEWNANIPETVTLPVYELVLRAVPKQPDAQAIDAWDGQLTYQELDNLSTLFALRLLDAGVRPQETVALCFPKSVNTPVAMLGVMKAGAIQVVLDVKQPPDRLRAVLNEIDEPLIVCPETEKSLATDLSRNGRVLILDNDRLKSMDVSSHDFLPEVDPKSLLYMIFTSGSTGRPKGVVVSHANVSSALIHQESAREMDHSTRTLDFTSYGFDAAYFSLCHTLHSGGCVCVPSDDQRLNDVGGAIRDLDATCALLPPSLLNSVDETDILRLRTIYLGGEPVPTTLIEKWHDKTHISIVYGPTETTIITSYWPTQIPVPSSGMLGKPSGLKAWIVDISGTCPVGINSVGEMWLEGPLVSQGYPKNPEQTNHAFIENPAWLVAGTNQVRGRHGRLYRTGDLVRYNEDGSLSFVGRKGGYVKIRGQRVDLGEVEHHVRQTLQENWEGDGHWAIVAEVITPQDSNRKMLVVFASPPGAANFSEQELKGEVRKSTAKLNERLSLKLPSYMVPSAYSPVTAIPLTATGKPDRRKLRKMLESQTAFEISAISNVIIPPRTPVEATIRDIWASVLNLAPDSISITGSFLELGGDSITAMQISSRCNSSNVPVSVREILNHKTIEKIAALSIKVSPRIHDIPSEHPAGELVGLSPIQRWFFDRHPDGNNHFNQTFLFKLKSGITVDDIYNASREVVSKHAMLRCQFAKLENLEWHQRTLPNSDNAFLFRQHNVESLKQIEEIAQRRQKSLDITDGCVFGVDVFCGTSNDLSILFTAHHLVVDLVSWRIIWQDIEEYIETKKPLKKTTSFLTWTLLQEKQARSMTLDDVLPSKVKIPEDTFWGVPLSSNLRGKALSVGTSLNEEETTLLLGKSNDALNTDAVDIMLATLKWTFEETFPERGTPPIFLEGHGREDFNGMKFDLSEIVGWFTSIYPVQVGKEPTLLETIGAIKDYRKSIPSKGREYFAYRYHNEAGRKVFKSHDHAEISFNYTGRFQQLEQSKSIFQPVILNLDEVSANSARLALIEINAGVHDKKLHVSISRHRDMNHGERLDNWIEKFSHTLGQVSHMLKGCDKMFTPSDFPLLPISRGSLKLALSDLADAGVPSSNIRDIYPATPIQNGIILSTKKQTASYQNSWVWKCLPSAFGEPVSPARLEKAWNLACQRHSILSTIFIEHPDTGHTIQALLNDAPLNVVHLKSESNAPESLLKDLKPHSLPLGKPPYSLTICSDAQGDLACRLEMSHALIDASALGILVSDVMKIYSNKPLPPAPAFKQVVERIQSRPDHERLAYWKNYLNGVQPCELPGVTSTKTIADATYGRVILSTTTTDKIEKFCKERQITRSMLLQLAWALMLSSFTGGDETCFGYLSSGRDMEDIGQVVGPSISLMVSRVSLTESLDKVISHVYRDSTQHFDYQHVSLAEVIHGLNLRGRRLFNTALSIRQEDSYQDDDSNEIKFLQTYGEDPHEVKANIHLALSTLTSTSTICFYLPVFEDPRLQLHFCIIRNLRMTLMLRCWHRQWIRPSTISLKGNRSTQCCPSKTHSFNLWSEQMNGLLELSGKTNSLV